MEEFNLSEKIIEYQSIKATDFPFYKEKDVKEFIKILKKHIDKDDSLIDIDDILEFIDKLAGDKLK